MFKRLNDEVDGFDCSYRLVALYVKQKKEELRLKRTDGYIPLVHHPSEGQADFGTADFYENSRLHHEAKYLVLSFPYSNGGFLQLNYGENMECLLEDWLPYLSTSVEFLLKSGLTIPEPLSPKLLKVAAAM